MAETFAQSRERRKEKLEYISQNGTCAGFTPFQTPIGAKNSRETNRAASKRAKLVEPGVGKNHLDNLRQWLGETGRRLEA